MLLALTLVWTFVFPAWLDPLFVAYTLARTGSYLFTGGECLINRAEKRILDPGYVAGSQPKDEPYVAYLPVALQWAFVACLLTLMPYAIWVTFSTLGLGPGQRPGPARSALAAAFVAYVMYDVGRFAAARARALLENYAVAAGAGGCR